MARKLSFRFVLACLLAACARDGTSGQTTGRIAGVVKDQSGGFVQAAEITAVAQATGACRTATTNEAGDFAIPVLPPGLYDVSVAANGFRTTVFSDVRVNLTEITALNVELHVGAVSESIRVNAAESLVQTNGPQLGRVVNSRGVSELPLATRNITQILGLSPGTATYLPDNSAVGRNTLTISVNGARPTQNNYEINGVDANTMGTSSAGNVAVPAPESVQEFKVQTSLYDATFGRSGGGNIQVVTRSGTNAFHGTVYEYFRDDALNANNPFLNAAGVPRPALKRNVFGGALGGPLRREKAFFFVSYQGSRERNAASLLNSVSSGVLIAPGLTDDRSAATLLSTFRPLLNSQLATAIDPTALALLNTKLPNGRFVIPSPQANGRYTSASVSRFQEDQFNANVDYLINARNALTMKAFFAHAPSVPVLPSSRGGGANVPGFGLIQENNIQLVAIQDTHTFTANVFNEARIGYNAQRNYAVPQEPVKDSDVGIRRANANTLPGLPLIRIAPAAGGVIIGTQTNISPTIASVATLADTVWIRRAKHALRAGAEVRFNQAVFTSDAFTRGQIDFSSFNNFLIGATTLSVFGSGIGRRNQRAFDYNFFFQDDWKVSPKWTLNLGMRYELDLPVYDTRGSLATFDPLLYRPRLATNGAGAPIGPPLGGFVQAGNVVPQFDLPDLPKVSNGLVKSTDPDNFGPRLGFAYSPFDSGRLAMRGGYGIFYSRATFQYISLSVTVPPTYILGRKAGARVEDPFFSTPLPGQFPTFVPGVSLSGPVLDRNIRTPYFQQYNLSVQYEWMKDLLLEVAYVGTRGLNLFRQVAINQARLASPQNPIRNEVTAAVITSNTPDNATLRAPFQGAEINSFFQNQTTAQSNYNSLQVSLTQRVSRGLQFLASYTYAKSIDNSSGTGGGAGISGVVNPGSVADTSSVLGNQLDGRANRGVSDFDRTHRFILSYLWDLPRPRFAEKSRASRWLLADWQLTGIITAMSGLPIDIGDTGAGSFYGLDRGSNPLARPNLVSAANCATATQNVPAGYFFNPFVFARPVVLAGQPIPSSAGAAVASATGTDIGNVGRNCLRGPSQVNVDLAINKRFPVRESSSFDFRAEFFNLFNHVNLANPISDLNAVVSSGGSSDANTGKIVNAGAFGHITSTSNNPRIIQFALKLVF
jgi:hypothetical protein